MTLIVPVPRLPTYTRRPSGLTVSPTGARSAGSSPTISPVSRSIRETVAASELTTYASPVRWLTPTAQAPMPVSSRPTTSCVSESMIETDAATKLAQ